MFRFVNISSCKMITGQTEKNTSDVNIYYYYGWDFQNFPSWIKAIISVK